VSVTIVLFLNLIQPVQQILIEILFFKHNNRCQKYSKHETHDFCYPGVHRHIKSLLKLKADYMNQELHFKTHRFRPGLKHSYYSFSPRLMDNPQQENCSLKSEISLSIGFNYCVI
jgi:hypothetical protein